MKLADESLFKAYSYAYNDDPTLCGLIRAYQAIVSALRTGDNTVTDFYLRDLNILVTNIRGDASSMQIAVDEIACRLADKDYINTINIMDWPGIQDNIKPSISGVSVMLNSMKSSEAHYSERAKILMEKADQLNNFCNFVKTVAVKRNEILDSSKIARSI